MGSFVSLLSFWIWFVLTVCSLQFMSRYLLDLSDVAIYPYIRSSFILLE
jgi:hypothetical protein